MPQVRRDFSRLRGNWLHIDERIACIIPAIAYDMFRREETIMKTLIDTPSRQTKAAIAAFVRCPRKPS